MKIFTNHKGFTLVELLVVISIIGILATLISANLNEARSRARDAVRKSDLKSVSTALRLYYNDAGSFPATLSWGSELSYNGTVYMSKLPEDPSTTQTYHYDYDSNSDTYRLYACLENASDPNCDRTGPSPTWGFETIPPADTSQNLFFPNFTVNAKAMPTPIGPPEPSVCQGGCTFTLLP